MKIGDHSPPSSPSPDQQRDALKKGLGRTLQWALSKRLDADLLLDACLTDQRFDMSVEDSRGDWLWRMIQAAGSTDRFCKPVLRSLNELSDECSATQLCELARCYAAIGQREFRTRLYEIVEQKPFPDSPWLGEEEILAIDGEEGFLFAARVRGRNLAGREWDWHDGRLIELASKRLGEVQVNQLLGGSFDETIARFRAGWEREKSKIADESPAEAHKERMKAIPPSEIIRAAEGEASCVWFRGWGRHAAEADLQVVLQYLWSAKEPRVIVNLLNLISGRSLPGFDARLIDLCRHTDAMVTRRAFAALEENSHPAIRKFALSELNSGHSCAVVALFIRNYEHGDDARILEAMELPDDECELHWLLMDTVKVLEMNPEADCSRLGVVAYALNPCENCRYVAARLLHQRHVAPDWLTDECRFDSGKECRELAENLTKT